MPVLAGYVARYRLPKADYDTATKKTWADWDISSKVPASAHRVKVQIYGQGASGGASYVALRTKGDTAADMVIRLDFTAASLYGFTEGELELGSDRCLQMDVNNNAADLTSLAIRIVGYFVIDECTGG